MEDRSPNAEAILKTELAEASSTNESLIESFSKLSTLDIASLFVSSLFLRGVLKPLIDEDWLRQNRGGPHFHDPRTQQMRLELRPLSFLENEIVGASSRDLKTYFNRTTHLIHVLVSCIQVESTERFREIATQAMRLMDARSRELDAIPHNAFSEAMYRAFDEMDEVLGIHYDLDLQMASDPAQRERLYEGAGIGVQTSYSSILLALDRAHISPNARVLDLGSGYGRVGFVIGLLRPDISFTGYEYVDHRVVDSNIVARRAGLARVDFETRDLSSFALPDADVYYMYDPFSRDTYATVLNQLIRAGQKKEITVITKGRANTWVREALDQHGWTIDETCDSGTVCLFRSPSPVSV